MLRAMDSAVAGLRAHQNKMDVIGNNIANVNTAGFKAQTYAFQEAMYQTSTTSTKGTESQGGSNAAQYGYGSLMGSIGVDMTASTPTYTGKMDAYIDGSGFFITYNQADDQGWDVNSLKNQDIEYTRVGQFKLNSAGYLTDGGNNFVYGFRYDGTQDDTNLKPLMMPTKVDVNGNDITLTYTAGDEPYQASSITINSAGEIEVTLKGKSANPNDPADGKVIKIGTVAIATFQNQEGLTKKGGNYWGSTENDNAGSVAATKPGGSTATLMTGYVEASNVDLSKEFADMITTQRGFQANSKIITVSDEMLSDIISMKR